MNSDDNKDFEEELEIEEFSGTNSDEMKRELERLQKENATLKKSATKELSLKVGQKGGVSLYGLGRFPVTLYKSQWLLLLDYTEQIREFLKKHSNELK
jgi:hypothetical protein